MCVIKPCVCALQAKAAKAPTPKAAPAVSPPDPAEETEEAVSHVTRPHAAAAAACLLPLACCRLLLSGSRPNPNRYAVIPGDFSERGGELTATLKLKRSVTMEKYAKVIDSLY